MHFILSHPHQSFTADKGHTLNRSYSLYHILPSNLCKQVPDGAQEYKETLLKQTAWVSIEDHKYLKVGVRNYQSFSTFLYLIFPEILSQRHYISFPPIFIMLI